MLMKPETCFLAPSGCAQGAEPAVRTRLPSHGGLEQGRFQHHLLLPMVQHRQGQDVPGTSYLDVWPLAEKVPLSLGLSCKNTKGSHRFGPATSALPADD